MKRIIAGFLFVLILLQSGGFMVCFCIQQELIREEMMEELKREGTETETIVLRPDEYTACRVEEHEIRYQGFMYDVRSAERSGDYMVIKALRDHKEESLINTLKKVIHGSRDKGRRVSTGVVLLSVVSYLKTDATVPNPAEVEFPNKNLSSEDGHYNAVVADISGPPPEVRFCS